MYLVLSVSKGIKPWQFQFDPLLPDPAINYHQFFAFPMNSWNLQSDKETKYF